MVTNISWPIGINWGMFPFFNFLQFLISFENISLRVFVIVHFLILFHPKTLGDRLDFPTQSIGLSCSFSYKISFDLVMILHII